MKESQPHEVVTQRTWEWFPKGSVRAFAAKVAILGAVAIVVGDRAVDRFVDQSSDAVKPVIEGQGELLRSEVKGSMDDVENKADDAADRVIGIEQNVADLKKWFEQNLGVEFNPESAES